MHSRKSLQRTPELVGLPTETTLDQVERVRRVVQANVAVNRCFKQGASQRSSRGSCRLGRRELARCAGHQMRVARTGFLAPNPRPAGRAVP